MSAFRQWLLSAATAQRMIAGQHASLLNELRLHWDGLRTLKDLSSHRERLVRLTKRAKRAMPAWHNSFAEELRGALGPKATARARAGVEAVLQEARTVSEQLLLHPPSNPAPAVDRPDYRARMQSLTPAQRRVVLRVLRSIPPAMVELLADQRRNGWLAAHVVNVFLDPMSGATQLHPWLADWAGRIRVVLAPEEVKNWQVWRKQDSRVVPKHAASLVVYRLGLIADALSNEQSTAAQSDNDKPRTPAEAATGADPSRVYTLKQASKAFNLKLWSLREAVRARDLKCSRPTASPNAPIQLRDSDIRDWLASRTGQRQRAERNPSLES